jgi:hypothetical protein
MPSSRLTPEQFRALSSQRGYTFAQLAALWELSPGRISQLAADPNRSAHFDYALWGLPIRHQVNATDQRRAQILKSLETRIDKPNKPKQEKFDADAHWAAITQVGMGFTSSVEFSESIPEGSLGIVVSREGTANSPIIVIQFDTGFIERFPLSYLQAADCPLWSTLKSVSNG